MAEAQFFGMPVRGLEECSQVISAVLVVKIFDEQSDTGVSFLTTATDGLTTVEALGMVEYFRTKLKSTITCSHEHS